MRIPLALAVAAFLAAPALAQPRDRDAPRPGRIHAQPTPAAPFAHRGPAGPVCIPWCPADRNPCDPPEFKIADARCGPDD